MITSVEIEQRLEEERTKEALKIQAEKAAEELALKMEELEKDDERMREKEKQRERDEERIKEAEDLEHYYNALKTKEIRDIKDKEELREAMKKDAEEAFAEPQKPLWDPDDEERDPDLNITPADNQEEREREEEEMKKKRQEEVDEAERKEKERLDAELRQMEEFARLMEDKEKER